MIHVKRHANVPKSLQNVSPEDIRPLWNNRDVRDELVASFGQKCAYCEQPLEMQSMHVDHFEPIELNPARRFDWTNLFPVCPECNRAKADRWPLVDQKPALLNPCEDEPEKVFLCNGKGYLLPLDGDLRASITIEVLDLNRQDLIQQRWRIYEFTAQAYRTCLSIYRNEGGLSLDPHLQEKGKDAYELEASVFFNKLRDSGQSPENPFAGVYFFLCSHFLDFFYGLAKEEWERALLKESARFLEGARPQPGPRWLSVMPELRVKRLQLQNIRCFKQVDLNLDDHAALFLGINGRGKSTLMQLLSLVLRGLPAPASGTPWTKIARFDSLKGQSACSLTLRYNDTELELAAKLNEDDQLVFEKTSLPQSIYTRLMVLAYGAGRTVRLEDVQPGNGFESIASLFGENGYLKNIQQAEVNTLAQERQEWFRAILNPIFKGGDPQVELVEFTTRTALFKTATDPKGRTPLEAMSDGFRATYAWLFDFLVRVAQTGHEAKDICGILMVDEIDLHLHPAWQRSIIPSLRKAFPHVQLIFSCHSPYCVQSMDTDKVFLLKQQDGDVAVHALELDGLPNGQNIEYILEKTIAIEGQLPSVGAELFESLKHLKRAAIEGNIGGPEFRALVEALRANDPEAAAEIDSLIVEKREYSLFQASFE